MYVALLPTQHVSNSLKLLLSSGQLHEDRGCAAAHKLSIAMRGRIDARVQAHVLKGLG